MDTQKYEMVGDLKMKICEPGCEFMLHGRCQLHEEELKFWSYETGPDAGKIVYIRCSSCEDEKEELEILTDLEEIANACERISKFTETEKRERLLDKVEEW
jgi:hypothetical protein